MQEKKEGKDDIKVKRRGGGQTRAEVWSGRLTPS